jgi:hypothetical protein
MTNKEKASKRSLIRKIAIVQSAILGVEDFESLAENLETTVEAIHVERYRLGITLNTPIGELKKILKTLQKKVKLFEEIEKL